MPVDDWIVAESVLPSESLAGAWESIITDKSVKERLLNQALLTLTLRDKVPYSTTALHGLILLYGPPGTGKTTLARGLAQELAPLVAQEKTRLIEVDPHGLMSAEHGRSQQQVTELLCDRIPALADDRVPTVVLLDEVESMAVARSEASLAANPADVHRATDAVLMALDRNAANQPHLITVATSNFTDALDEAFRSRADLTVRFPLPDGQAIVAILRNVLGAMSDFYPALGELAKSKDVEGLGARLDGLDGRQVRKLVTEAMALRRETVLDPGALTVEDLQRAGESIRGDIHLEESSASN